MEHVQASFVFISSCKERKKERKRLDYEGSGFAMEEGAKGRLGYTHKPDKPCVDVTYGREKCRGGGGYQESTCQVLSSHIRIMCALHVIPHLLYAYLGHLQMWR